MKTKIEDKLKANGLLESYTGSDPYFRILKAKRKRNETFSELDYEYILNNYNTRPRVLNKLIKVQDWVAEQKKDTWQIEHLPTQMVVHTLYGETSSSYFCDVIYSRHQEKPVCTLLPKSGLITPLIVSDFDSLDIDFTPYNEKLKTINTLWSIMPHQERSVKFLLDRKKCILALDQGLGKSLTTIVASEILKDKRVLIICPASLKMNWKNEITRFADESEVSIIRGINEMNRSELIEFLELQPDCKLTVEELKKYATAHGKWKLGSKYTILNFDIIDDFHQLPASRSTANILSAMNNSKLLNSKFDIVIIDEAHKLSNSKSDRSKIMADYLKKANNTYTWLLTGTMLTNNPANLYNVLRLIENEVTGDYVKYMEQYAGSQRVLRKGEWERCWNMWSDKYKDIFGNPEYRDYKSMSQKDKDRFKEFVDKYGKHAMIMKDSTNLEELSERIQHLYFRMTKEEIPNMVKKEIIPIAYSMTPDQAIEYHRLWDEYEEKRMKEDGVDMSEMKTLIEGSVYRQYISKLMLEKTKYAVDKLNSQGNKVFVVCAYDEEIYTLQEYFGSRCVIYNGKITAKAKEAAVDAFNNDDSVMVFLGNINAAGVGINLNKSCHIALFQNPNYTYADFSQVCDRIHRIGSTEDVKIYVQYFRNTIYEHMIDIIKNKQNIFDDVVHTEKEKASN